MLTIKIITCTQTVAKQRRLDSTLETIMKSYNTATCIRKLYDWSDFLPPFYYTLAVPESKLKRLWFLLPKTLEN